MNPNSTETVILEDLVKSLFADKQRNELHIEQLKAIISSKDELLGHYAWAGHLTAKQHVLEAAKLVYRRIKYRLHFPK